MTIYKVVFGYDLYLAAGDSYFQYLSNTWLPLTLKLISNIGFK